MATSSHWCVLSCAQWGGKWEFEVGEHRIEEENRTRASEVTVTRDPKVVISGLIQSRQACGSKTDGPAFLHRERRNPCTRSLPLLICQRCVCREREYSMQRVLRHDCTWHAEKNKTMRKIVITRCATAREHEKLPNGKSRLGHIIGDSLVVGRLNDMVHCPLRSRLERQWSLSNFGSTDFRRLIFWRCVCVVMLLVHTPSNGTTVLIPLPGCNTYNCTSYLGYCQASTRRTKTKPLLMVFFGFALQFMNRQQGPFCLCGAGTSTNTATQEESERTGSMPRRIVLYYAVESGRLSSFPNQPSMNFAGG